MITTNPAVVAAQTAADTNQSRVWEVRSGTAGTGLVLFHVYQPTMEDARQSVLETAEEVRLPGLLGGAFTVHALTSSEIDNPLTTLGRNVVTDRPAALGDDWFDLLATTGVEVRLDTSDGLVDATYLANDGAGMILVRVGGQLQEVEAAALHPRCACGNPINLCHPDA
jgi:hypothetical protein